MQWWCQRLSTITLRTIHHANDDDLLTFLSHDRSHQRCRERLYRFYDGRQWYRPLNGLDLSDADARGLSIQQETGHEFVWLCVTNAGASQVNLAALSHVSLLGDWQSMGYHTDPNSDSRLDFYACLGVQVRLTRNLDKDRSFVNGAVGTVEQVLKVYDGRPEVFTFEVNIWVYVIFRPIRHGKRRFHPCTHR